MSAVTKVLIVLILILSAFFAASQIILFGKRENFGAMYNEANAQLQATRTKLADTQSALQDKQDQYDLDTARLSTQNQTLTTQLASAQDDIDRLEGEVQEHQVRVDQLTGAVQGQTEQLADRDDTIRELEQTVASRDETIQENQAKIADLNTAVADRDSAINSLENELLDVKKDRKELAESEAYLTSILEELRRRDVAIPTDVTVPPIDGRIVRVDAEYGFAVINKGSLDQVKSGTEFTVYEGADYIATLAIHDVREHVSVGRIIRQAEGEAVEVGDTVTTRVR